MPTQEQRKAKNRAGTACFRYDVYGRKSRNAGYDNTDDDLNDIGRMEFRDALYRGSWA